MAFDPEKVDSYEAGWKAALFDRRLQFALAVFEAKYKDVQIPGSLRSGDQRRSDFRRHDDQCGEGPLPGRRAGDQLARLPRTSPRPAIGLISPARLGYLDAKYLSYQTVVSFDPVTQLPLPRPIDAGSRGFPQDPEHAEMDAERDRSITIRRLAGGRLNLNTTVSYRSASQQFEAGDPRARPGRLRAVGRQPACGVRPATATNSGSTARTSPTRSIIVSGYNFLLPETRYTGDIHPRRRQCRHQLDAGRDGRADRILRQSAPGLAVGRRQLLSLH